jgi:hypothetical protein
VKGDSQMPRENWSRFSVRKATEGGISQRDVKADIQGMYPGLKVRFFHSCYVGDYGVEINTTDKRKLKKIKRDVFRW